MSSNRENALAAMLSRALAAIDNVEQNADQTDVIQVKREGTQLLANWRTQLSGSHVQAAGLTDVGIVGTGGGWLIQFVTDPMAAAGSCQGKVTLIRRDRQLSFSNMAMFFRLAPDSCFTERMCDPGGLAAMVALFASIVLEVKGLAEWQPETVVFSGIAVPGAKEAIPRAAVAMLPLISD